MRAAERDVGRDLAATYVSEVQFRQLVDKLPAAVYTCDAEGLITYCNRNAAQMWGREPALNDPMERFCGSLKLFTPDGLAMKHEDCWMAVALKDGKAYNGKEFILERPDGRRLMGLAYINPIHAPSGQLLGAVNVLVDVTEQKKTEALLAGQKRVLEMLAKGAELPDVLATIVRLIEGQSDGIIGSILVRRPDGARFSACVAPGLDERFAEALVHAPCSPPYLGPCGQAVHLGEEVAVDDIAADTRWPASFRDLAAELDLCACYSVPIFASDGAVLGSFGMYLRETGNAKPRDKQLLDTATYLAGIAIESKRAEQSLHESEDRFRGLFNSVPVAVFVCDSSAVIQHYNRRAAEFWGREPKCGDPSERYCGSMKLFLPDGTHLPHDQSPMVEVLRHGVTIEHVEVSIERPDGSRLPVIVNFAPLRNPQGEVVGAITSFIDITERKQAEEIRRKRELEWALEKQMDEERRRVGRELHDGFQQQLLGIGMLSSTLVKKLEARKAPETELMQEFSKLLRDTNSQLRGLIHNLTPVKVDADGLVPALQRACMHIEQWYGVACCVHVPSSDLSLGDDVANHLFHIAQEAMINAAKHSNARQVEVFVRIVDGSLVLQVRDEGDGIPDDYEKRGGMGVGSMRQRADLIGADLSFSGRDGTTVTCALPVGAPTVASQELPN